MNLGADNKELLKEASAKANSDARKVFELFRGELGQEVLELFREMTIERPSLPTHVPDGIGMGMLMAHAEGEKNFVRKINLLIKQGSKVK